MDCDIAIIGYGPVGATAAALLGGQGLKVLVVERMAGVYDKPRAITADHEVMRCMQFAGIGTELGAHVRPHPGTRYLGVDGNTIKQTDVIPPPYPLGWPTGIHFIQPEFEAMLRNAVARHGNIQVLLSHDLVNLAEMGDGITLTVMDLAQAQTRSIHARYLLACDGANSFVRRKLGIGFEDLAFDEWWIVVDAWQRRPTALPEMNTQYCWPSRPASAIAGPRNLRRWELKILPHEKPEEFQDDARVRDVLAGFVDIDAIELWRSAVYRFHALVAAQWNRNRIFLLGDCAHQDAAVSGPGHVRRHQGCSKPDLEIAAGGEGRSSPGGAVHLSGRAQDPCPERGRAGQGTRPDHRRTRCRGREQTRCASARRAHQRGTNASSAHPAAYTRADRS